MPRYTVRTPLAALLALSAAGCATPGTQDPGSPSLAQAVVVDGFNGPEAVRYDPEADVYFVANWNGSGGAADNNGFISRMRPDGTIEQLRFIEGGANGVTLHAPRGMTIVGDTLWTADIGAVRGFHRRTGAPVATVDFSGVDTNFLNDITPGPSGVLYVTDTGKHRVYRIQGRTITTVLDDTVLNRPNGITWDRATGTAIVVPIGGKQVLFRWNPSGTRLEEIPTNAGGRYDGVELLGQERMLVSSQADSMVHVFVRGQSRGSVKTLGAPADIGVDTRRNRVAVPFIARNQVQILPIPAAN